MTNVKRFLSAVAKSDGVVDIPPHERILAAYLILSGSVVMERIKGGAVEGDNIRARVLTIPNAKPRNLQDDTVIALLVQKARDGKTLELSPDAPLMGAARRVIALMTGAQGHPQAIVTHHLSDGGLRLIPKQDLVFIY